jgi:hypothetical protein
MAHSHHVIWLKLVAVSYAFIAGKNLTAFFPRDRLQHAPGFCRTENART